MLKYESTVREHMQSKLENPVLDVACEEFIIAAYSSYAKKSYARLDIVKDYLNQYATILNELKADPECVHAYIKKGVVKLTIKGVTWASMSQLLADRIRTLFLDVLLSGETNGPIERAKADLMSDFLAIRASVNTRRDELVKYCRRVKMTGKQRLVEYLQGRWNINPEEQMYVYVLPLIPSYAGQPKAQLYIPLEQVNESNVHHIDEQEILAMFNQQVKKFFIKKGEGKSAVNNDR